MQEIYQYKQKYAGDMHRYAEICNGKYASNIKIYAEICSAKYTIICTYILSMQIYAVIYI